MSFEQLFQVDANHLDTNLRMRKTAYVDAAADVRLAYLAAAGFTVESFARQMFGPVIRRERLEYIRELQMGDQIRTTLLLAGVSGDASRFWLRNEFWDEHGTLIGRVTSMGGWIELRLRRLVVPPPGLASAIHALERSSDFEQLEPVQSKGLAAA
jgi:acyl-CoA thioester hydrolase